MHLLTIRRVVVATDLDATSHAAVTSAHRLAATAGAALHVVHVADTENADPVREILRTVNVPAQDARVHVIPGEPAETIRAFADRMEADVIVVGPHRERDRVTGGHPLGGTARAIAAHASAPCLIAAQPLRLPLERVLVPVDFSDTSRGALLVGVSWASGLRAHQAGGGHPTSLTALYVDPGAAGAVPAGRLEGDLDVLRRGPGRWGGVELQGKVEHGGDPARVIGRQAADLDADLVVLGTRGAGADEVARLGSVSASVTLQVRVPILLVPPAVWRVHGRSWEGSAEP